MANIARRFDIARLAMTQLPSAAPQFSPILMLKLMNSTNRSSAVIALLICAAMLYANSTSAQESDVFDDVPSSVTSSLISRKELSRLLHQPPRDRNPLRRASPIPQQRLQPPQRSPNRSTFQDNRSTFRDPNVRAASWQQEQPNAATGIQVNKIPDRPQVQDFSEPKVDQGFPNTPPLQANPETTQTDTIPAFGPQPSFEMQSSWHMLDILLEIPVDKLKEKIAQRRAEIESSLGIDEASRSAALKQIEDAEAAAQQANQHTISKADFQNRVMELKPTLEQLRQESKKITKATPIDRSLPVNSMQVILRDLQTELGDAKSIVEKIQDRIQRRDERMDRIPAEQLHNRNEENDLHEQFLEQHSKGTKDIDILLALKARELAASTNVQLLDQEASWHDLSQELLPLQKTIRQREVHRLEQEVKQWSDAIANRKQVELEKQIRDARQKAIATHPDLKEFSQQTAELAQARAVVAEKIGDLQAETLKVSKQHDDVKKRHDTLDKSIREAGEEESRELLIQVHRNLIRPYEGMARILDIESERRLTRGTILKLRSEKEQIADSEVFIREQLKIEQDKPIAGTTLIAMAEAALETHLQQLIELERDSAQYEELLKKVLLQREDLLEEINTTRELVDTHALWIQSADPFSVALIAKSGEGAKEFFDHAQWSSLGNSIVDRVTRRPYECVLGMLGLLATVLVGRRFKG